MKVTVEQYLSELKQAVSMLEDAGYPSVVFGGPDHGFASFVAADSNEGVVEISRSDDGVWLEFWRIGAEDPESDLTVATWEQATGAAKCWLASGSI